ncbi:MAG: hypothetical protein LBT00_00225 [Spirochaetaceae bacterium]|nr:hypothetical protein [Spirochaetaceae bacterium]
MPCGAAIPADCCLLNSTRSKRRAVWCGCPRRLPLAQQNPPKEACYLVWLSSLIAACSTVPIQEACRLVRLSLPIVACSTEPAQRRRAVWCGYPCRLPLAQQYPSQEACHSVLFTRHIDTLAKRYPSKKRAVRCNYPRRLLPAKQYPSQEACCFVRLSLSIAAPSGHDNPVCYKVANSNALIVCLRFSASSQARLCGPSITS